MILKKSYIKKTFLCQKKNFYFRLECGYCQKKKCGWKHHKFQADCQYCRKEFCKNCYKFNITFEILLKQTDEIGKNYLENFVKDFLQVDNITFENLVSNNTKKLPIQKKIHIKSYVKSEKNRIQVVNKKLENVEKLNYNFKGQKRSFYQKINFVID